MRSIRRTHMLGAICMVSLMLIITTGCGNENDTAPYDAQVIFTPDEIKASIAADTCFNSVVKVTYSTHFNSEPIPGAQVIIWGAFASPRQGALPRYYFYEGPCTWPLDPARYRDSGFAAKTDDNGIYEFAVLVTAASGTFTDTIYASSGAVFDAQDITIE